ncbi:MAG: hypothetical protein Q8R28_19705, partial [Dehalococcoidia bacterium]|nr:hypothetical protein [Dehalococcoidia bacterium]
LYMKDIEVLKVMYAKAKDDPAKKALINLQAAIKRRKGLMFWGFDPAFPHSGRIVVFSTVQAPGMEEIASPDLAVNTLALVVTEVQLPKEVGYSGWRKAWGWSNEWGLPKAETKTWETIAVGAPLLTREEREEVVALVKAKGGSAYVASAEETLARDAQEILFTVHIDAPESMGGLTAEWWILDFYASRAAYDAWGVRLTKKAERRLAELDKVLGRAAA